MSTEKDPQAGMTKAERAARFVSEDADIEVTKPAPELTLPLRPGRYRDDLDVDDSAREAVGD